MRQKTHFKSKETYCSIQGKKALTNQSTPFGLTWIKGPTFGHNQLRQETFHVD